MVLEKKSVDKYIIDLPVKKWLLILFVCLLYTDVGVILCIPKCNSLISEQMINLLKKNINVPSC
jgi:hypothetical protein